MVVALKYDLNPFDCSFVTKELLNQFGPVECGFGMVLRLNPIDSTNLLILDANYKLRLGSLTSDLLNEIF